MSAVEDGVLDGEALLEALIAGELPDAHGRFGPYGGRYVPETLIPALQRLEYGVREILPTREFESAYQHELRSWVGRPTALSHAPNLSAAWGADVWLKREDLAHTGAHKINNAIGQALLASSSARSVSSPRPAPASTAWPRQRPAHASACRAASTWGRSTPNARHRTCGACTCSVPRCIRSPAAMRPCAPPSTRRCATGCPTPRAPTTCSARRWGPHPYPLLVRHAAFGDRSRVTRTDAEAAGGCPMRCSPAWAVARTRSACSTASSPIAGWRSSASKQVVAAFPWGITRPRWPAASRACCTAATRCCCSMTDGQIQETHSVSAGLDYPGVGPEHALLQRIGRVRYEAASDDESLGAGRVLPLRRHPAGDRDGPCVRRCSALGTAVTPASAC
jgi:tryptophan synthase beta chain